VRKNGALRFSVFAAISVYVLSRSSSSSCGPTTDGGVIAATTALGPPVAPTAATAAPSASMCETTVLARPGKSLAITEKTNFSPPTDCT